MKKLLITLTALTLSATAYAHGDQGGMMKEACAADVATTGCTGEGKEKMKCMHEYKKANKDFKFSEGCKMAFKDAREDRKEKRMERKAKKDAKAEATETK